VARLHALARAKRPRPWTWVAGGSARFFREHANRGTPLPAARPSLGGGRHRRVTLVPRRNPLLAPAWPVADGPRGLAAHDRALLAGRAAGTAPVLVQLVSAPGTAEWARPGARPGGDEPRAAMRCCSLLGVPTPWPGPAPCV